MRIDLRDNSRNLLGRGTIDPATQPAQLIDQSSQTTFALDFSGALDDQARLCRCPVCGCRDLFRRKDAPQRLGLILVVLAAASSIVLFALDQVAWSILVLLGMVIVDFAIGRFMGQCLVCYRCRSEFRETPVDPVVHEPWDLAIGEKYRQQNLQPPPGSQTEATAAADETDRT
ncbi:MAG: hypothetical protein D8M59_00685 [Planctomycetes bacterium]|nr:hypothetical protein [Planctomycetota bacterium]NOG54762.1 hypothetical protein [Planctomycetota bacterium]